MPDDPIPSEPDASNLRLPHRQQPRARRTAEQANAATFAALFAMGLIAFALIGLVALVLPQVRGLVLVVFGGVGFFAAHYLIWGWWLPKIMRRRDEAE